MGKVFKHQLDIVCTVDESSNKFIQLIVNINKTIIIIKTTDTDLRTTHTELRTTYLPFMTHTLSIIIFCVYICIIFINAVVCEMNKSI